MSGRITRIGISAACDGGWTLPRHQCFPGNGPEKSNFPQGPQRPNSKVVELLNKQDASYEFIGYEGNAFWFQTDLNAPRGRIVAIDIQKPDSIKTIVPEAPINSRAWNWSAIGSLPVPEGCALGRTGVRVVGQRCRRNRAAGTRNRLADSTVNERTPRRFIPTSASPTARPIYRYDLKTGTKHCPFPRRKWISSRTSSRHEAGLLSRARTEPECRCSSPTKGPREKREQPDAALRIRRIRYLASRPRSRPRICVWLEMGGVYAVANLRGGGEYGEEWHQAGTKLQQAKCVRDFIAAGEWLIANKYTSTPSWRSVGGSNGGLLVGACMTQRPDFSAPLCRASV